MINHVNAKHTATKEQLRTRTERGMHVEKENDPVLKMEHDYGRITTMYEYNDQTDDFDRVLHCARCSESYLTKGGIKQHLTKHNEVGRSYGLSCPYCPATFSTIAELNIHIYLKPACPARNKAMTNKTWPQIWSDICTHHRR